MWPTRIDLWLVCKCYTPEVRPSCGVARSTHLPRSCAFVQFVSFCPSCRCVFPAGGITFPAPDWSAAPHRCTSAMSPPRLLVRLSLFRCTWIGSPVVCHNDSFSQVLCLFFFFFYIVFGSVGFCIWHPAVIRKALLDIGFVSVKRHFLVWQQHPWFLLLHHHTTLFTCISMCRHKGRVSVDPWPPVHSHA